MINLVEVARQHLSIPEAAREALGVRPDFPEVIDATQTATMRSCMRKQELAYMPGNEWKPMGESIHLIAGAAFARGLEVTRRSFYEEGKDNDTAIADGIAALVLAYGDFEAPEGSAKTLDRMVGALVFYFDAYPMETDKAKPLLLPSGRRAIEFSFATPLPYLHPVTRNPIIYAGRSDMIATYAEGTYVEDDKTTSQLGASWSKQWDLRSQFTGYCWSAREAGMAVNGVLVRGVSVLKTKYDTLEAITYRSPWEIDRWLTQICRDLKRLEDCWREGYYDYALDHACTEYGGCSFAQICKSPNPEVWLPMNFERKHWDPLTRTETPIG